MSFAIASASPSPLRRSGSALCSRWRSSPRPTCSSRGWSSPGSTAGWPRAAPARSSPASSSPSPRHPVPELHLQPGLQPRPHPRSRRHAARRLPGQSLPPRASAAGWLPPELTTASLVAAARGTSRTPFSPSLGCALFALASCWSSRCACAPSSAAKSSPTPPTSSRGLRRRRLPCAGRTLQPLRSLPWPQRRSLRAAASRSCRPRSPPSSPRSCSSSGATRASSSRWSCRWPSPSSSAQVVVARLRELCLPRRRRLHPHGDDRAQLQLLGTRGRRLAVLLPRARPHPRHHARQEPDGLRPGRAGGGRNAGVVLYTGHMPTLTIIAATLLWAAGTILLSTALGNQRSLASPKQIIVAGMARKQASPLSSLIASADDDRSIGFGAASSCRPIYFTRSGSSCRSSPLTPPQLSGSTCACCPPSTASPSTTASSSSRSSARRADPHHETVLRSRARSASLCVSCGDCDEAFALCILDHCSLSTLRVRHSQRAEARLAAIAGTHADTDMAGRRARSQPVAGRRPWRPRARTI